MKTIEITIFNPNLKAKTDDYIKIAKVGKFTILAKEPIKLTENELHRIKVKATHLSNANLVGKKFTVKTIVESEVNGKVIERQININYINE